MGAVRSRMETNDDLGRDERQPREIDRQAACPSVPIQGQSEAACQSDLEPSSISLPALGWTRDNQLSQCLEKLTSLVLRWGQPASLPYLRVKFKSTLELQPAAPSNFHPNRPSPNLLNPNSHPSLSSTFHFPLSNLPTFQPSNLPPLPPRATCDP